MLTKPKLEQRKAQPYIGIRSQISRQELGIVLPPLSGEVFAWLEKQGVERAGPPFWRYFIVDMEKNLEIDVGVPVPIALPGERHFIADILPAGRYATALHTGHPDELEQATASLLAWAEGRGIEWRMDGERWGGRIEWYLSDPATEPDTYKWRTELAFLTADHMAGRQK
jgi:effector-binding domain-containing protein